MDDTYINNDNYKIEYEKNDSNVCAIYFSSNGIFAPNNEHEFRKQILERNKYEYRNAKVSKARKHIFIRDPYKQWYVCGINSEINSMDKLHEFLLEETKGYEVITAGTSSGGYASIIMGTLLKAKYSFAFSPQIDLLYAGFKHDPLLEQHKNDVSRNRYYNIVSLIENSNVPIFYFTPAYCREDGYHYNLIKKYDNIYSFVFKTKYHGTAMYNFNVKYMLNLNCDRIIQLQNRYKGEKIGKTAFAIKCYGVAKGLLYISKELRIKIKQKLKRKVNVLKSRIMHY